MPANFIAGRTAPCGANPEAQIEPVRTGRFALAQVSGMPLQPAARLTALDAVEPMVDVVKTQAPV
jgi:hypothetical protein